MFWKFLNKKICFKLENGEIVKMTKKQAESFLLSLEYPFKKALNSDDILRYYKIERLYK